MFRGGSIINGSIYFNSNRILGNAQFNNCKYKGKIIAKCLDDRCFTSGDDKNALLFLLTNAIENGAKCDFYRDYSINMKDVPVTGLLSFKNINSGADISFHGHTIYNTVAFSIHQIKPVIVKMLDEMLMMDKSVFHD